MNVLITGGYGFIGSHIADRFHKEGHKIFIIDNLSGGNKGNISFGHESYIMDVENEHCDDVFKQCSIDVVIHLAAQIDVQKSISNPLFDVQSNIMGLVNMLQLSSKYKIKKFVFASSASVYGNNSDIPLPEEALTEPLSVYGINKLIGELYCRKWNELYKLDTVCFRLSNVYGPRQGTKGEGGVVSIFLGRLFADKELIVFGDGNQTRDYIFVQDVAEGIYRAVNSETKGIYNLSTSSRQSVNKLIDLLKKMHTIKGILYMGQREGDIYDSSLDNSKIKQALAWTPELGLEEGISRTYNWYLNYHKVLTN